jgi:hypothetical protein
MILMAKHTRVSLETGKTWVFAIALDYPGWCRRGKGEEAALEVLSEYADRYRAVVGPAFKPGELDVVGRVESDMHADFGAPGVPGPWDAEPLTAKDADRMTGLLEKCWQAFDAVVAKAPKALAKGPRGGGRDRDAIVDHVREAERAYGRKLGAQVPPRTPWPEQRAAIAEVLRAPQEGAKWPARYGLTRIAWHVTDHAWEIEDRGGRR